MKLSATIAENYESILNRIALAAQSVGRDPDEIRLVVVTKGHPLSVVDACLEAGIREIGENYPEEGSQKVVAISAEYDVKWHMIGHIQSRKARLVSQHFNMVHSLDRLKLASRLNQFASDQEKVIPVLLEFNVSGETTKFGWPADDQGEWEKLIPKLEQIVNLPNLDVRGLMTIPPWADDPGDTRKYFDQLVTLKQYLGKQIPAASWNELSMGMSADFEIAIHAGATIVRVGTSIVGPRL